jgi:ABC-type lipoprotein export system ATPase subunit
MPLTAEGLSFGYPGSPRLLDGLDLSVPDGGSAAIMAPSGVGKSTLLAVLGGLRSPTAGLVKTWSESLPPLVSLGARRPRVAWVFQSMHLLPARTALDNVTIAGMPRGLSRATAQRLAHTELDRFGVGELAGRMVRSLSGGQCQRVALARASVADPLVVLADEPTANLDRDSALAVAQILVHGFPRASVVIATHDAEVAALASLTYTMRDGLLLRVER